MRTMKKLILLFSIVAVSFALQAGDNTCQKDKAACGKDKAAGAEKAACDKAKAEGKGCCAAMAGKGGACAKGAKQASSKKPLQSPKAAGAS
jgi:hypothetical protein